MKIIFAIFLTGLLILAGVGVSTAASITETITVSTSSIGFTTALLTFSDGSKVRKAFCSIPAYDLRFRVDGTAPTSTVGHLIKGGSNVGITFTGVLQIQQFRAIKDTGSADNVIMTCTYEN